MPSKASARWLSEVDVTSLLDIHTAIAALEHGLFPIVAESSPERRAEVLRKWGTSSSR